MRSQTASILADDAMRDEVGRRLNSLSGREFPAMAIIIPPEATTSDTTPPPRPPRRRRRPEPELPSLPREDIAAAMTNASLEAIVLRFGRPSLLIRNDTFEVPPSDTWRARLYPAKTRLDRVIRSVGRVEVDGIGATHLGTAWMVAPGIAVTNRHVALLFAQRGARGQFPFRTSPIGQRFAPRLDFREEAIPSEPLEAALKRVLYIAPDGDDEPDIAFLEVGRLGSRPLPPPIPMFDGQPAPKQIVATIGYPAADSRNAFIDQQRIFGGVFDVKRLAPGEAVERFDGGFFSHDCSTLGGSSGSVVVDVTTGAALGLHFAGVYLEANYAVASSVIRRRLANLKSRPIISTRSLSEVTEPAPEGSVKVASLAGRTGFDSAFLGTGELRVPFPTLSEGLREQVTVVDDKAKGSKRWRLEYEHFSVVMHRERRLALFTAVNIDGAQQQRLKRESDVWSKDPRIPLGAQVDNRLYAGNDLDRGHLVRRLDPTWGPTAKAAQDDTFFFTNCSPQHARYNQSLWADLEDYLLDNAETEGFRASIFTGPVFAATDPTYRDVRLPGAYWKVAVMVRADGTRLSATGYLVSQSDLLTNLEFVYGQFKTYQVSIGVIQSLTGISFGPLTTLDPLHGQESAQARELTVPSDITVR